MKLDLVPIGNSKGIRLTKNLIEKLGVTDKVECEVIDHGLLLTAVKNPREGWDEHMAKHARPDEDLEEFADWLAMPGPELDEDEEWVFEC